MGISSLTVICALFLLDLAESRPTTSTHAPPRFVIVHDTNPKQGTIVLSPLRATIERVPVKQLVNVNGQIQERTIFYNRGKYHRDTLDARDSCVMTPDGTQLPIDEVWKRLKPGTVLVVSGDGNRPAPAYLRALRADALVFIPAPPMKLKP